MVGGGIRRYSRSCDDARTTSLNTGGIPATASGNCQPFSVTSASLIMCWVVLERASPIMRAFKHLTIDGCVYRFVLACTERISGRLGLFAEGLNPRTDHFAGNMPLLFSHAEYVRARFALQGIAS